MRLARQRRDVGLGLLDGGAGRAYGGACGLVTGDGRIQLLLWNLVLRGERPQPFQVLARACRVGGGFVEPRGGRRQLRLRRLRLAIENFQPGVRVGGARLRLAQGAGGRGGGDRHRRARRPSRGVCHGEVGLGARSSAIW